MRRFVLLLLLAGGCAAGRATFECEDESDSVRYPDARIFKYGGAWKVRLWARADGAFFDVVGPLIRGRPFLDVPLPAELKAVWSDFDGRAPEGRVVIKDRDPSLKRVRGEFDATTEDGHRIHGWFTARWEDDDEPGPR